MGKNKNFSRRLRRKKIDFNQEKIKTLEHGDTRREKKSTRRKERKKLSHQWPPINTNDIRVFFSN